MILNYTHRRFHRILCSCLVMLIVLLAAGERARYRAQAAPRMRIDDKTDLMVFKYATINGPNEMMLYDPRTGEKKSILNGILAGGFSFSVKGLLAYSVSRERASTLMTPPASIYIWDTTQPNSTPIKISPNEAITDYPLAWSPDGRYLAFGSAVDFGIDSICVWDGKTIIDITPSNLANIDKSYGDVSWSFDGRLAFTVHTDDGKYPHERDVDEIYLWDGKTTSDLSQDPQGSDEHPLWSPDGRIAFYRAEGVFVWDGVSVKDGAPDKDTFTMVSSEVNYLSSLTWTNKGLLAFGRLLDPNSLDQQIFVWNGQTVTNVSQIPGVNHSQTWSANGRWALINGLGWPFDSTNPTLSVRDANNRTLLEVEGQFKPAWSSNGYLAFCRPVRQTSRPIDWVLSIWDGQQVIEILQGAFVAQWQNGAELICSPG